MKIVLLTRKSEFQIYCANYLWKKGFLSAVVVEDGYSFHRSSSGLSLSSVRKLLLKAKFLFSQPSNIIDNIYLYFNKPKYFGDQQFHNKRVLRDDYFEFLSEITVKHVASINSDEAKIMLRELNPELILVFGTSLIKSSVFKNFNVEFINMHWGWSPDFRGEGIISALANSGVGALGVTIHSISSKIDGGNIYFQARPKVDKVDNFYSIGLKLTMLGTRLFIQCVESFNKGDLQGVSQDLTRGNLYTSKTIRSNPKIYRNAWYNLKSLK
jgi:folate-dependent phosphoribosylglycinamide formyltransferase PurN